MPLTDNSADSASAVSRRHWLSAAFIGAAGLASGGCTVSQIRQSINAASHLKDGNVSQAIVSQIPGTGIVPIDSALRKELVGLLDSIGEFWSDKKTAGTRTYVKYSDHYQSRAIIDFESGHITVETVVEQESKAALKKAIVQTLLTPRDPTQVDLFSAKPPQVGAEPFLLHLVEDQDKQAIRYLWRANRFADYLLANRWQTRQDGDKTRYQVQFDMVGNYRMQQRRLYAKAVYQQCQRFGIEPALVFAIIETESSFNPFAVSSAPAYGLMQIVPQTAGRDVYELLNQRSGSPSQSLLFNPLRNIEYGTAYLSILQNRYLNPIYNAQSLEYCMIAAYNTGAGNVLRAFSENKRIAFKQINRMDSEQVYQHLRQYLSTHEARQYLYKVRHKKTKYLT
ncbi:DUF3393 domain-containing protein [Thiomicrorhabdus sediminis]|uniref:DUF3393 domain-containing protein n=2 Tax=Thiomicrorhabdus sediminis TaxID=2580412 RepID=A0A4V1HI28_9GAMM|nr:DUF3393 domain-containing protein [Thiomicrorhabdus sediminis]